MLRIDPANHVFGLRINVLTSVVVFLGAVAFLVLRRPRPGVDMREDPALLQGPAGHPGHGDRSVPDDAVTSDDGQSPDSDGALRK
jgi:hypothetical protein